MIVTNHQVQWLATAICFDWLFNRIGSGHTLINVWWANTDPKNLEMIRCAIDGIWSWYNLVWNVLTAYKSENRNGNIIVQNTRLGLLQNSFRIRGAMDWNELPKQIRESSKIGQFKGKVRSWIKVNVPKFHDWGNLNSFTS